MTLDWVQQIERLHLESSKCLAIENIPILFFYILNANSNLIENKIFKIIKKDEFIKLTHHSKTNKLQLKINRNQTFEMQ